MLFLAQIRLGILFNAFVSSIIAFAAFMFMVSLFKRWRGLNSVMRTYAFFWIITALVWSTAAVRYVIIAFGSNLPSLAPVDIAIQSMAFATAPIVYYYLGLRLFSSQRLAMALAFASSLVAIVSIWFLIQPNGILYEPIFYYSADSILNQKSLIFFSIEAALAVLLLIYDFAIRFRRWLKTPSRRLLYSSFYSLGLIVYFLLGGIDHIKIFHGWILIFFRTLYIGITFFAYMIFVQEEVGKEDFFVISEIDKGSDKAG